MMPERGRTCLSGGSRFLILLFVIVLTIILLIAWSLITHFSQQKPSGTKEVVILYNWAEYTDESILADFEKQTGIKVILKEFDTSEEELAKIQTNPGAYDIVSTAGVNTDFMKKVKLLQPLDLSKVPNIANVPDDHRNKLDYTIPYLCGTTGLVINTKFVPPDTDSLSILWDSKYNGKIVLLDEPRDVMAVVLKYSGFSANSTDPEELKLAEKNALLLKKNAIRFGEDSQSNLEEVLTGRKWIGQVYSDIAGIKGVGDNDVRYILPKEGFFTWCDFFAISSTSPNPDNAHKLLNFFLRPDIAARTANTLYGHTSIIGAEQYLKESLLNNTIVYPSDDDLKRGESEKEVGGIYSEYLRIFYLIRGDM